MNNEFQTKMAALRSSLKEYERAVVAFSGGMDSGFLSKMCRDVLGDNTIALTVDTFFLSRDEISDAERVAYDALCFRTSV